MDRRRERRSWHGSQERRNDNGADNAVLEQKLVERQLEDKEIYQQERFFRLIQKRSVELQAEELERGQLDVLPVTAQHHVGLPPYVVG